MPASQLKPCFVENVSKAGETSGEEWFLVREPADSACAKQGDAHRAIHYYNPTSKEAVWVTPKFIQ